MKDTFDFIQKPYNLKNDPEWHRRRNRTVSVLPNRKQIFACPKIWELIHSDIRNPNSLGII